MTLDVKRQAMLDVCCHLYKNLASCLDIFDTASQPNINYDCYAIVRECFDPAVKEFGIFPSNSDDKRILLNDLLGKIEGAFKLKHSNNQDIFIAFLDFKKVVIQLPFPDRSDIHEFDEIGKKLSCDSYVKYCNREYSGINRDAQLVIHPANKCEFSSIPQKMSGSGKVEFSYGTSEFDFMTYLNSPFYFFHEYLSHIHSANFFSESCREHTPPFEDGWLIYFAFREYKRFISSNPEFSDNLSHKEHYLNKYIYSILNDENKMETQRGYELAEKFEEIAGKVLFPQISLSLATTDHDSIQGYSPVHTNFLIKVGKWLKKYHGMEENDKEEQVEYLNMAMEDKAPVKSLLDIL